MHEISNVFIMALKISKLHQSQLLLLDIFLVLHKQDHDQDNKHL